MPIRVAIVEDNRELREGLSHLIGATPGFAFAGSYGSCDQFLGSAGQATPDVVLMDIELPGISGIEGVKRLKESLPHVEVLMLTVFEDERRIFDSLCAGASGYLLKRTPPAKLLEAIQEAAQGGAPMTPSVARRVLQEFKGRPAARTEQIALSDREQTVLSGLVEGKTYQAIADENFISLDTVRSYVKTVYQKLQVNSKAGAVAAAMRKGLV